MRRRKREGLGAVRRVQLSLLLVFLIISPITEMQSRGRGFAKRRRALPWLGWRTRGIMTMTKAEEKRIARWRRSRRKRKESWGRKREERNEKGEVRSRKTRGGALLRPENQIRWSRATFVALLWLGFCVQCGTCWGHERWFKASRKMDGEMSWAP